MCFHVVYILRPDNVIFRQSRTEYIAFETVSTILIDVVRFDMKYSGRRGGRERMEERRERERERKRERERDNAEIIEIERSADFSLWPDFSYTG